MLKLKMMLCDDVAAGRRRLHISSLPSVREATTPPAWIMQPPRLADTAERIISPSERSITMQKQSEGNL